MEQFVNLYFWDDMCQSRDNCIFFYHMANSSAAKSSRKEGHKGHVGKANHRMNQAILAMCKEFPLSSLAYTKDYLLHKGVGDMFNLKQRVIRSVADNVVRYVM